MILRAEAHVALNPAPSHEVLVGRQFQEKHGEIVFVDFSVALSVHIRQHNIGAILVLVVRSQEVFEKTSEFTVR